MLLRSPFYRATEWASLQEEAEKEEKLREEDTHRGRGYLERAALAEFSDKGRRWRKAWLIDFGSRRMKTHHILTSSLLIPNVRFFNSSFSSFTLKDVTPFSEVKLVEGNPPWQVQMSEKVFTFGSVSEVWSWEYERRPSQARCSSNTITFYLHLPNLPAFFRSTNVFVSADSS